MIASVTDGRIQALKGDPDHPANFGRLCTKGLTAHIPIQAPTRLTCASARTSRGSERVRISIDEAVHETASRMRAIVERDGPDAVAMYVSGQMSSEAQYAANKLCKGFIGTNNIDSNSRLCMASAASGYKLSLGADAPPGCYEDFDHADLFFVIGSNMADCHPILFLRMMDRKSKSGAKLIVADPRKTATADKADLFLPLRAGTDLTLLYGLLHLLIRNGCIDEVFIANNTEGWDETVALVQDDTPERVAEITGLCVGDIETAARWIGERKAWMSLWTMGLNQSVKGTWNTSALCNLHLATGSIGFPGAGPFSLTGQPNAMGGREVGYLSHALPGQRCVIEAGDREFIERVWNRESGFISPRPGLDTVSLFKALEDRSVKAVWIIATNPVASVANRKNVIAGLTNAELVIVQDAFHPTETSEFADVLLPGALWAEAEGTMVNSERRITLMNRIVDPPGEALPDWLWITRVAWAMGYTHDFSYQCAEDIFNEMRRTSNYKSEYVLEGVTYDRLKQKSLSWPCYSTELDSMPRRYLGESDGMRFAHANGKARFIVRRDEVPGDAPSENFPIVLTTGRLPHQWHTRTKTGHVEKLNRLNPAPFIQMNPAAAAQLDVNEGDMVRVESINGTAVYPARLDTRVKASECFVSFHWNDGLHAVNQVVSDACDPVSLQPEFKFSAVRLSKMEQMIQEDVSAMNTELKSTQSIGAFSDEQKEFLQGLMAGYRQQGLVMPGAASPGEIAVPESETVYGTTIDDLCKEEKIKHELNGLDVWGRILSSAEKNIFPEGGDVFRFKYHGLFYVSPAQEAYMLRCRIPGGILSSMQLRGLADIAEQWGGGYASITTRANMQIRDIQPKNAVNVLTRLYDIGLTSKGSGADNVRNITASPTSGIDPDEVYDVRPLAKALHYYILNDRELYGLPRKFNIAFDNGGAVSVVMDTNDVGFLAVRVDEGHEVEPGIYFRVQLGGITGHGDFAQDAGVLIQAGQCLPVAVAIVRVFIEHGDRTNRKKARLKYLIEKWGLAKFLEKVEKKLSFKFTRFAYENCRKRRHTTRHGHLGIFRQSQPGFSYVGVKIPVGQMKARQMRQIADIADSCGSSEVRLTVWQNLIIPNVSEDRIPELQRKVKHAGFDYQASAIMGGLVACTGNTGCKFSSTNTKGQAMELAAWLENKVKLDRPINIHLTGCPHSCAQYYCGDIGLLGVKVTDNGESVEGYNVLLGGGVDQDQGLAREVFKAIPFTRLPALLERVLNVYLQKRNAGESFVEFTRRHEIGQLQELFSN